MMIVKQIAKGIQLGFHHDGNPHVGSHPRLAPLKCCRCDAHNRVWVLIDLNCLAHDVTIRTEMRLPESVADHGDGRASRLRILLG